VIKRVPADFIVEEKAGLPLRPDGEYRVYELRKSGWTTPDIVRQLSRTTGVPGSLISYGGKKDKHGITSQFVALRDPRDLSRRGKDFSLRAVGFMDRPMGPDLIQANAFTITIRDIPGLTPLERNIEEAGQWGFPNFFDDQRFRSFDPERGFFAEKILRRHWNGALQVYLTSAPEGTSKIERERKAKLFKSWRDWPACLILAREPLEKAIFAHLARQPRDYPGALRLIPEDEVAMRYAAFQSHLWNELLRRLLGKKVGALEEVRGRDGSYLFWRRLDADSLSYLQALEIPTAAASPEFPNELTASLYAEILEEEGLRPGMFRTKELRRVGFRSFMRKALLLPGDLRVLDSGEDDLHPGREKLTISFSLPRGAYGTMLIKRLELDIGEFRGPMKNGE
jgi:tRNA pseudouridine13 synthase